MSFWRPQLKSFFNLFSSCWNSAIASFSAHLYKSFQFSCWEIINLLSMKSSPGRNFRQACRVFYYVSNQRVNVFVLSLNFQCIVNYLVRHLLTLAWPIFFNRAVTLYRLQLPGSKLWLNPSEWSCRLWRIDGARFNVLSSMTSIDMALTEKDNVWKIDTRVNITRPFNLIKSRSSIFAGFCNWDCL